MAEAKYSKRERELMAAVRQAAERDMSARCWWCGTRPWDLKWAADHVFPLLKASSPIVAACARCNRRRNQKIPNGNMCQRLFHGEHTVRSVPAEVLRQMAESAATELFGSAYWIPLLIAAVDGKKPVYHWNGRDATEENKKLAQTVGALREPTAHLLPS